MFTPIEVPFTRPTDVLEIFVMKSFRKCMVTASFKKVDWTLELVARILATLTSVKWFSVWFNQKLTLWLKQKPTL